MKKYSLSIDELKQKFGDVRFEVISHNENKRITCVRRSSDGAVLAYSSVIFYEEGVRALGGEWHEQIVSGKPLGEIIKSSGVPHERIVSDFSPLKVSPDLAAVFATKKKACASRTINYSINGVPYALITEFYNPEFTSVEDDVKGE